MNTSESYPFFDQRIEITRDAKGRVTRAAFTERMSPSLETDRRAKAPSRNILSV